MEHDDHMVMMMSHTYTPLSLVEGQELCRMVSPLDPYIIPITTSKLTRILSPQKFKKAYTDVSSFLDGVCCVGISYDLWVSKTTQENFSMTAHYTRDNVRENYHIEMPTTTSTDG